MKRYSIIITALVFCLIFTACTQDKAEGNGVRAPLLDFVYQDVFEGFTIESANGQSLKQIPLTHPYTLVIYLSDSCGPCVNLARTFPQFLRYYAWGDLGLVCLWADEIPRSLLEKHGLNEADSYALKGEYRLGAQYPTLYLLDDENTVVFTTNDLGTMVDKLIKEELILKEDLVKHANQELWNQYGDAKLDKPLLVEFSMEGCPDCEAAEAVLQDDQIASWYQVVKVYRDGDRETLGPIDEMKYLARIYEVDWYPTFVILDGTEEEKIIREVPIEQLKDQLLP